MNNLQASYDYCREVMEHHSKTFSKAFSALPKQQRKAVWAIYAFCRKVDDIVDEGTNPVTELAVFECEFNRFLVGEVPGGKPMWIALRDVFHQFEMDEQPFIDMIKGQRKDLYPISIATKEELLDYSYHVASTVGLMLLPVIAPGKEKEVRQGAIELGYAMQITNILRDIGEDMQRKRMYLPMETLLKHGCSMDSLRNGEVTEAFINVWEELATDAEDYYARAMTSISAYPVYSRIPVKGAAFMYRAILNSVRGNGYQVFRERNFVDEETKKQIIAKMQ
ncbi:phytoene/squalene synthase family protein [Thalassobacillus hwangdonensis]|uniref:Phytoene/squalene synthase family protein n=1 Tax=Thalassobacillus hwangdonensis TaxID=546108 RepID=A0ABW3L047_9BACI